MARSAVPTIYQNNGEVRGQNYDKIPAVTRNSYQKLHREIEPVFHESCPSYAMVKTGHLNQTKTNVAELSREQMTKFQQELRKSLNG